MKSRRRWNNDPAGGASDHPINNDMKLARSKNRSSRKGVLLAALTLAPFTQAQSSDAIIDKLVEKGILTVKEAKDLRDEADKDFSKSYAAKSGLQEWVQALKINGDLRGRYEGFFRDEATLAHRDRFRYRMRLGVTANIVESFEVGVRLASGDAGSDPISTNQSMQDNGTKKGVTIDLAYGKWTPINNSTMNASLAVGKIENPFVFSDMVFDGDYTPEGVGEQLGFNLGDHALKFNLGQFILDEVGGSERDPWMFGAQARFDSSWSKEIQTSLGVGWLTLQNEDFLRERPATTRTVTAADGGANPVITTTTASNDVPNVNRGNSRDAAGNLRYNYQPIVADAAITYNLESFPFYTGPFPVKLAGDFMHNPEADDRNNAYSVGLTLGKAGKKGTWELSYRYKVLGGDVWWEEVVDSDFGAYYGAGGRYGVSAGYQAGTNVRGHIFKVGYSPYDFVSLNATYFLTEAIDKVPTDSGSSIGRLQVDASLKF